MVHCQVDMHMTQSCWVEPWWSMTVSDTVDAQKWGEAAEIFFHLGYQAKWECGMMVSAYPGLSSCLI